MLDVLLVDDDEFVRKGVAEALVHAGHHVTEACDGEEALAIFTDRDFDVAIFDVRMPKVDGLTLLRRLRRDRPSTAVVIMTSFGRIHDVVSSLRDGAVDYVSKPFDPDLFVSSVVGPIAERRSLLKSFDQARARLLQRNVGAALVGGATAIRQLEKQIDLFGKSDASILVTGERGSGKKLVARMLHAASPRREGPRVEIACAALSRPFHAARPRGAPYDDDDDRVRRWLRDAEGGVLVLDGIEQLPAETQASLAHQLEQPDARARRSSEWRPLGARVIALTRVPLTDLATSHRVLEGLLFRVSTMQLRVPPLRERRDDLYLLVAHMLRELTPARRIASDLTPRAWKALFAYDFPGNVAELARGLEAGLTLADGAPIDLEHLPHEMIRSGNDVTTA